MSLLRRRVRHALAACLCAALAALAPVRADPPAPRDLRADLAALVDGRTPGERQRAAAAFAGRADLTLPALLDAMRGFGEFPPAEPGTRVETLDLAVGATTEATEVHLRVPPGYDPGTRTPLLLALHGTGGSGGDEIALWRGIADRAGWLVLAPTEAGRNEGYRFDERERASAIAALRWARRHYHVDEDRIVVTGVSRGGHMAWDLALRRPDLFAAVVPMIGAPRLSLAGGAANLRYLENLVDVSIRDLQGARDDPLLLWNVRHAFERLKILGARDAVLHESPALGHSFSMGDVDWTEFLGRVARTPRPERVIRRAARPGEGRSFFAEVLETTAPVAETFAVEVAAKDLKTEEDGPRRFIAAETERRTARLVVRRTAPGRFTVEGVAVKRFRLLLAADDLEAKGVVEVTWQGQTLRRKPTPSRVVLLREFAERFDRGFLPVADLVLP